MNYKKFFLFYFKRFFNSLKRMLLPLLFIIIIFLAEFGELLYDLEDLDINLNPFDYCNLTDVDYTAVLHDDPDGTAKVSITEYLTFDVHAASKANPFRELWRELPEDDVDGVHVSYNVHSVKQVLKDGSEIEYKNTPKMYWEDEDYTQSSTYRWHHSSASGRYPDNDESVLIYIPWTYRDTLTFKIEYDMINAALKYKDCSELYLSLYSGNSITKLKSFKAQILVPNEIMPKTYYAYSFGTKNSRIPFIESNSINPKYHTFSIDLDQSDLKFQYHDRYIEFALLAYGQDKHIFTQNAPNNLYTFKDVLQECIAENEKYSTLNKTYGTIKIGLLAAAVGISALLLDYTKKKISRLKEENSIPKPTTEYDYFREIPSDLDPVFASDLVFSKDPFDENIEKEEEYAAVLLSLARKKYLNLEKINSMLDWDSKNTLIRLNVVRDNYFTYPLTNNTSSNLFTDITNTQNNNSIYTNDINNNDIHNNEIIDADPSTSIPSIRTTDPVYPSSTYSNTTSDSEYTTNMPSIKTTDPVNNIIQGSDIIDNVNTNLFDENLEPLTVSEKLYLDLLLRYSKNTEYKIVLSKLQECIDGDYDYTKLFVKDMEKKPKLEIGLVKGYYRDVNFDKVKNEINTKAKNSFILGLVFLIACNLISFFTPLYFAFGAYTVMGIAFIYRAIYLKMKSSELLLLTQYGTDERAKWYGLYRFLNSDTLINEKTVNDITLWEKYLIYATAFGVSDKVIKAIKLNAPYLNIEQSPILNNNCYIHSKHFHTTSKSFGTSLHTSYRAHHGGGHFGYGGGGRGGGGGGGGH